MIQKKFCISSTELVHVICTRKIQFTLQNIHVVSFSNNNDVICCFIGRSKGIFNTDAVSPFFISMTSLNDSLTVYTNVY